jgi:hypothetical protein
MISGVKGFWKDRPSYIPEALFNCVHILPIGHGLVSWLYLSSLNKEKFLVEIDLKSVNSYQL